MEKIGPTDAEHLPLCDGGTTLVNPRSLEYDGERLVPDDSRLKNLLIEDLSKFHFASQYADGKLILDAGCGAGQGTSYLARSGARYVVGVDIALDAVAYAYDHYIGQDFKNSLAFGRMNVTRLGFTNRTFDMITSIEVIEHLTEPETYVAEMRRVLKDDGILVLSTPNKYISSPAPGSMWPHHIHEFYTDELQTLLRQHFATVEMWGMSIPVYDTHPIRQLAHWLAPIFKPILPLGIRTRFLPMLQKKIKSDLTLEDISFSQQQVTKKSTLVAVCHA
jgi:2-polyprenyl-3-methyl-5-hydroxy-6-metoxy-1,4-benzoquinol methylase